MSNAELTVSASTASAPPLIPSEEPVDTEKMEQLMNAIVAHNGPYPDLMPMIVELFAHPKSAVFFTKMEDDCDGILYDLPPQMLAHAINTNQVGVLTIMVQNGLMIQALAVHNFLAEYNDYEAWKEIAVALQLPLTFWVGAYDFEKIPYSVYEVMIRDLGVEGVRESFALHDHDYHTNLEGYISTYENAEKRRIARATTGLRCPMNLRLKGIDVNEH